MENLTRVIAVTSGKGGVGKSNFSINLAIAFSQIGKKVVVLDADLGLSNVNVLFGVSPTYNLSHVIHQQKLLSDVMIKTKYGPRIISGASGVFDLVSLTDAKRKNIFKQFKELENIDIFIIDTAAGVSKNVLTFLDAVDDIIIVTTTEPTAITDAYGLMKIIRTELESIGQDTFKLVINRVKNVTEGRKTFERLSTITKRFLQIDLSYLGFIYEDLVVHESVLHQIPTIIKHPHSKFSNCINHIRERLEKIEYKEGVGINNFFSKIFHKKEYV